MDEHAVLIFSGDEIEGAGFEGDGGDSRQHLPFPEDPLYDRPGRQNGKAAGAAKSFQEATAYTGI